MILYWSYKNVTNQGLGRPKSRFWGYKWKSYKWGYKWTLKKTWYCAPVTDICNLTNTLVHDPPPMRHIHSEQGSRVTNIDSKK